MTRYDVSFRKLPHTRAREGTFPKSRHDASCVMGQGPLDRNELESALADSTNIASTARRLGVSHRTVHRALKRWPELKMILPGARERMREAQRRRHALERASAVISEPQAQKTLSEPKGRPVAGAHLHSKPSGWKANGSPCPTRQETPQRFAELDQAVTTLVSQAIALSAQVEHLRAGLRAFSAANSLPVSNI